MVSFCPFPVNFCPNVSLAFTLPSRILFLSRELKSMSETIFSMSLELLSFLAEHYCPCLVSFCHFSGILSSMSGELLSMSCILLSMPETVGQYMYIYEYIYPPKLSFYSP